MKTLGQRVRDHRESLGLNPSDYARLVGTSRQNINNVEAGEATQPRYIGKLAKAMGVTVDALLTGLQAPAPQSYSAAALRVAAIYDQASPKDRRHIDAAADTAASPDDPPATPTRPRLSPMNEALKGDPGPSIAPLAFHPPPEASTSTPAKHHGRHGATGRKLPP